MIIRGRWLWLLGTLFVLSIVLNLLAVGAFGALHMAGQIGPRGGGWQESIPAEARPYFRQAFRSAFRDMRSVRRELKDHREGLADLARAETFDRESFRAALTRYGETQNRGRAVIFDTLTEAIAEMPPELRRELNLERFRFGPPRGPRGPKGPGRGPGDRDGPRPPPE